VHIFKNLIEKLEKGTKVLEATLTAQNHADAYIYCENEKS
jgi:hypothetical protein